MHILLRHYVAQGQHVRLLRDGQQKQPMQEMMVTSKVPMLVVSRVSYLVFVGS